MKKFLLSVFMLCCVTYAEAQTITNVSFVQIVNDVSNSVPVSVISSDDAGCWTAFDSGLLLGAIIAGGLYGIYLLRHIPGGYDEQ